MTPDILDLTLLPALALVCSATSFSDLREGKIRNKALLAAIAWALTVYVWLSVSRFFIPDLTAGIVANSLFGGSWGRFLLYTGMNALSALVCGFLLFHFDLWSAGDAKLFFVLALLLPLKYYFRHYLPVFPAFNLFLNTIAAAAVFVWADTAWKIIRFAAANKEKNIWREIAGAVVTQYRGGLALLLGMGVAFSLALCATRFWRLNQRVSTMLMLCIMLAMLFFREYFNKLVADRAFRLRLGIFAAVLFSALLLSPLRPDFLHMALFMFLMFTALYLMVGILPSLAAKYGIVTGDMPFATWLTAGLLATMVIRGSFLYLALNGR
ncbi:MAG: hypothetical protein NTY45_09055 [Elusimicrobia bacterium]|nr:hypothetical protein [Elusimicrobiota bacterium]